MRLALLAMGALLVQCAVAQTAAASCGDWLAGHATMATDDAGASGGMAAAQLRNAGRDFGIGTERSELPGQRPCNGPDCRQLPTIPDAPFSPTTTRVVAPQWLLGASLTSLLGLADSGRVPAERSSAFLPAEQDRIERPPRSC